MAEQGATGLNDLESGHISDLHALAAELGIPRFRALRREELVQALVAKLPDRAPSRRRDAEEAPEPGRAVAELERTLVTGILDLVPDGFGFLRVDGLSPSPDDVYVARRLIREAQLRRGDEVTGAVREPRRSERYPSLVSADEVNGAPAADAAERHAFESMGAVPPDDPMPLVHHPDALGARMVDLVAAPRKGDRVLVSAPPKTGGTSLLLELAAAATRAAAVRPVILLVDARPEEVSEWQKALGSAVHATAADRSPDAHVRVASLALERAKRLAEGGEDVIVVLDSISRLARAHRLARSEERTGRAVGEDEQAGEDEDEPENGDVSLDEGAVRAAARWLAAGRATEEGGTLTVVTAVRAGSASPLEQLLMEELADSASVELRLDRELADAGLFPALDPTTSSRREAPGLAGREGVPAGLREALRSRSPAEACAFLLERLREMRSNDEVLAALEREA